MSEPKFTPGPWYDAGPLGAGIYVISEKRPVAVVYGPHNEAMPQADARLITAAPDLYAACEAIEYESDRGCGHDVLVSKIRFQRVLAALAKARGEVRP